MEATMFDVPRQAASAGAAGSGALVVPAQARWTASSAARAAARMAVQAAGDCRQVPA